jgi:plastocyanin
MIYTRFLAATAAFASLSALSLGCSSTSSGGGGNGSSSSSSSSSSNSSSASSITCPDSPTTHMVTVALNKTYTFTPQDLTICTGDTVAWTWAGNGHDVTSGTTTGAGTAAGMGTPDNNFCNQNNMDCANAPLENSGNTYSFQFMTAGTFPYYCRPHVIYGMTGSITVQ